MANEDKFVGKKIVPAATEPVNIGIDTDSSLASNIIAAAESSTLDISALENFTNISQNREQIFSLIDSMSQDSTISSVLETYAEDTVEMNDQGKIVWCESSDDKVGKYINFLLDSINVDKHIYKWAYMLIKYGDLYLKLFRQSDFDNDLIFKTPQSNVLNESKEKLDEEVKLKLSNDKLDHYVHYVEAVTNPAEMFELTKHGKTMGYIQAPTTVLNVLNSDAYTQSFLTYKIKQKDITVYQPTDFVHAALENVNSRTPEEVRIFLNDKDYDADSNASVYKVVRGQSLLYNEFKIWRQISLLENSVLLNRLTKSSIVRMISVEVGDMPKENIATHLQYIKQLIEQKSSLNTDKSYGEYTNPGPVENNIYIPTHQGVGAISTQEIGGNPDVKALTDLDWFNNKFFAGLRVPKQFFGFTDDAAGFNGGTSLSIISSRYGKSVKRIQNTLIQAITDLINLMLLDKGLNTYVNKFTIKMNPPVTQEELDKREALNNKLRVVADTQQLLQDVSEQKIRLSILKAMLSDVLSDPEIISLLQEQIDLLEEEPEEENPEPEFETPEFSSNEENETTIINIPGEEGGEIPQEPGEGNIENLPTPAELAPEAGIEGAAEPEFGESLDNDSLEQLLTEESEQDSLPSGTELGVDLTDSTIW